MPRKRKASNDRRHRMRHSRHVRMEQEVMERMNDRVARSVAVEQVVVEDASDDEQDHYAHINQRPSLEGVLMEEVDTDDMMNGDVPPPAAATTTDPAPTPAHEEQADTMETNHGHNDDNQDDVDGGHHGEEEETDNFERFEWDIEKALDLCYVNSGARRFNEEDVQGLKRAIQGEAVSLEERIDIMRRFLKAQNYQEKLYVCAACGVQSAEEHNKYRLREDLSVLKYSESELESLEHRESRGPLMLPVDDTGRSAPFYTHKILSFYESPYAESQAAREVYHLHPEFVDVDPITNEETACLCKSCSQSVRKAEVPKESIASGIDFGDTDRIGLVELNDQEQAIIALVRHATRYVKVKANKGASKSPAHRRYNKHVVLFEHNAVYVALKDMCNPESWFGALKFMFVGPSNQMEQLVADTFDTSCLVARPFAIYQWLSVLKEVNHLYRNIDIPTFTEVTEKVGSLLEKLKEDAFRDTRESSLVHEHTVGADVAQQRHVPREDETIPLIPEIPDAREGDHDNAIGYSLLIDPSMVWRVSPDEANARFLEAASDLFETSFEPPSIPDRLVPRSDDPIDEMGQGDYGLSGAFPTVFVLGKAYGRKGGPLTVRQRRHLLHQFTKKAATCRPLLFYLYDLMQRFHTIRRMHRLNLKDDSSSLEEFRRLIHTGEIKRLLEEAKGDSTSVAAKRIIKLLKPITSFAGQGSYWGAFERVEGLKTGYEKIRHYGNASQFLTVGPDDINNPSAYRRTIKQMSNGNIFPSTVPEDYLTHLISGEPIKVVAPDGTEKVYQCDYYTRAGATMNNPVAMVTEYIRLLHNTLSILLGLPPSNITPKTRKTLPLNKRKKGLFGHTLAYYGVSEPQSRGTLHFHIIIWGGIPPDTLQRAAGNQELTDEIDRTMKTMYSSSLPKEHLAHYVARKMLKRLEKKLPYGVAPLLNPPSPDRNYSEEEYEYMCVQAAAARQFHEHSTTCHKPPNGAWKCRLNKPDETFFCVCGDTSVFECNCRYSKCKPVRLTPVYEMIDGKKQYSMPKEEINFESPLLPPRHLRQTEDLYDFLYSFLEDDTIVYELPRPKVTVKDWDEVHELVAKVCPEVSAILKSYVQSLQPEEKAEFFELFEKELLDMNGYVTTFNGTLSLLMGSNTACLPLFNSTMSKAALFYLFPYVSKNKMPIDETLTLLEKCYEDIQKHPSRASDSGTTSRTATHLLTRFLNKANLMLEISDCQAAAALLDLPTAFDSDRYVFVNVGQIRRDVQRGIDGRDLVYGTRPEEEQEDDSDYEDDGFVEQEDQEQSLEDQEQSEEDGDSYSSEEMTIDTADLRPDDYSLTLEEMNVDNDGGGMEIDENFDG